MGYIKDFIEPFWDESYKDLYYKKESFTKRDDIERWRSLGYNNDEQYFTGEMCPFGEKHPEWSQDIINWVKSNHNLKNLGICYYRMETGVILPEHSDHYTTYINKFKCDINQIHRLLIFLEDWKSGHYFEVENTPITNWKMGDCYMWNGETKHMAANMGPHYRYTLQITGWK